MKSLKPTIPEVMPLVRRLYERHNSGCCLHVVLDDGNIDAGSVAFSYEWAVKENCIECQHLLLEILGLGCDITILVYLH